MYPAHGQTYASTHTRCHTTSNDDLRTFMPACLTRVSSMTKSNGSVRSTHDKRTTHAYLPQALQIPRASFAAVALVLSPCPTQAMSQSVALRLVATFLEARRRRRRQRRAALPGRRRRARRPHRLWHLPPGARPLLPRAAAVPARGCGAPDDRAVGDDLSLNDRAHRAQPVLRQRGTRLTVSP